MTEGQNLIELAYNLRKMAQNQVKVQTIWAVVKEVDWDDKTMIATGVSDELDYLDVKLGLGGRNVKPEIGSYCLLGVIENQEAAAFLIEAEQVEEYSLNAGKTVFKSDGEQFSISTEDENLGACMDGLVAEILNIYAPKNVAKIELIRQRLKKVLSNGTE